MKNIDPFLRLMTLAFITYTLAFLAVFALGSVLKFFIN